MGFAWSSVSAKTLGIVFSNGKSKVIENNLISKLNDFINCLKRWNHRNLPLMGKVIGVKTFPLPKLIYPLSVLNNQQIFSIKSNPNFLNLHGIRSQIMLNALC